MDGDKLAKLVREIRKCRMIDELKYPKTARQIDELLAAHESSAQGVGDGVEYEFEIEQDGEFVAGGTTSTPDEALSEATHYEVMYGQDGPVTARFWRKQQISRDALAAPTKGG